MKAPAAPPPLVDMAAHKAELEARRKEMFPKVKAAIEKAKGNVTKAAIALFLPDGVDPALNEIEQGKQLARVKVNGMNWTRVLGLREYARTLRKSSGQTGRAGRPRIAKK